MKINTQIWIVDFGSQYTQLIARRIRSLFYSCEVLTLKSTISRLKNKQRPEAIVLSGGPLSISLDREDYNLFFKDKDSIPILGICYGMQIIADHFNAKVEKGKSGEYGQTKIKFTKQFKQNCFEFLFDDFNVWMSHFDHVLQVPNKFEIICKSEHGMISGIRHLEKPIWGLQFHPEVEHSEHGNDILSYYFKSVAKLEAKWNKDCIYQDTLSKLEKIKDSYVLCGLSGGVDSLAAASLSHKVFKQKLYCIFVDNGLLRKQDYAHIEEIKSKTNLNIDIIDAKDRFLNELIGVSDPEKKRKIIGRVFIEVFEAEVKRIEKRDSIKFTYLLQGTLYPDVIESFSPHTKDGKSVTIKSHHNVGGLPDKLQLKLLEPFSFLFKDEVRSIGSSLGLPSKWIKRHPFPGPGLSVRILGEITNLALEAVRNSDQILFEEMQNFKVYDSIWQAFTVFLPVKTVGVKGDARVFEYVICLRLVNSIDGMTANWCNVPFEFLDKTSRRITNEVNGITRVVYDITSKPPGTIEWE